jgi:hypothetical protein
VAAQPQLPALPADLSGVLPGGRVAELFRVQGRAGQSLFFATPTTGDAAEVTLFGPTGDAVLPFNTGPLYQGRGVILPADGEYLLALTGPSATPFSHTLIVREPAVTTQAYALGTVVGGVLNEAGDAAEYTFSGTSGQRLYLDLLAANSPALSITSPSGEQVASTQYSYGTDIILPTLTETGTYTVRIGGFGGFGGYALASPGAYAFRLLDESAQPAILSGGVFTVTLSAASANAVSINYATADSSAAAGTDYLARSGTLLFNPGETQKSFKVYALPNPARTSDASFAVNLTTATGTAAGSGVGTIRHPAEAPHAAALSIRPLLPPDTPPGVSTLSINAGQTISPALQVDVLDQFGNPFTGGSPRITLALSSNPGGAPLLGTVTASAVNGVATFSDLSIRRAGFGYVIAASSAGLAPAFSTPLLVQAGPAVGLAFLDQPTSILDGQTLPPFSVGPVDQYGNSAVTTAPVTVTVSPGQNPPRATLLGTTAVTTSAFGSATFGDLKLSKTGAGFTLQAQAPGLGSVTSGLFDVQPVAVAMKFLTQPSDTPAGLTMSPAVTVQLLDADGKAAVTSTAAVTLELGNNPGSATLSGPSLTAFPFNGVVTFGGLSLNAVGDGYTLRASSDGLPAVTSDAFKVTPPVPVSLEFLDAPADATAGDTLKSLRVRVVNSLGATATDSSAPVTLQLLDPAGQATAQGTLMVRAVNGVATFSDLSVLTAGQGYRLVVTAGSLPQATSDPFAVTAATASALRFGQQPTRAPLGGAITPAVQVRVEDAYGNLSSVSAPVRVALADNPNGATLGGTTSVTPKGGVATFADLTLDQIGRGYTLRASADGLPDTKSQPFDVRPIVDLQVTGLKVSPADGLHSGDTVTVSWNALNAGRSPVTDVFFDRLDVTKLDTGEVLITRRLAYDPSTAGPLGAGQTAPRQVTLRLPDGNSGTGRLAFTVTTDATNAIVETNADGTAETNNTSSLTETIALAAYPDLQVSNLSLSPDSGLQSGDTVAVRWDDSNTGTGAAGRTWYDYLEVDNATTGDTLLTVPILSAPAQPGAALAAGASRAQEYDYRLPDGTPGAGSLVFTVIADYYD